MRADAGTRVAGNSYEPWEQHHGGDARPVRTEPIWNGSPLRGRQINRRREVTMATTPQTGGINDPVAATMLSRQTQKAKGQRANSQQAPWFTARHGKSDKIIIYDLLI